MIVISQALVATLDRFGANRPVIGYDNRIAIGNIAATSAEVENPVTNLANPASNLIWTASTDATQYITVEWDELTLTDYVGVARHNFGSQQIVVSVEGYEETDLGSPEWFELCEETLLADDAPAILRFTPTNLLGVRLKLQPAEDVFPSMAVMYAGKLLELPRPVYVGHTPITLGVDAEVSNARSENGSFLGRIVLGRSASTGVQLQHIPPRWYREHVKPFTDAALTSPFFWAWRPAEFPREVGYAWLTSPAKPQNSRPEGFIEVELSMGGIVT